MADIIWKLARNVKCTFYARGGFFELYLKIFFQLNLTVHVGVDFSKNIVQLFTANFNFSVCLEVITWVNWGFQNIIVQSGNTYPHGPLDIRDRNIALLVLVDSFEAFSILSDFLVGQVDRNLLLQLTIDALSHLSLKEVFAILDLFLKHKTTQFQTLSI